MARFPRLALPLALVCGLVACTQSEKEQDASGLRSDLPLRDTQYLIAPSSRVADDQFSLRGMEAITTARGIMAFGHRLQLQQRGRCERIYSIDRAKSKISEGDGHLARRISAFFKDD